jgi:hypothetical protein
MKATIINPKLDIIVQATSEDRLRVLIDEKVKLYGLDDYAVGTDTEAICADDSPPTLLWLVAYFHFEQDGDEKVVYQPGQYFLNGANPLMTVFQSPRGMAEPLRWKFHDHFLPAPATKREAATLLHGLGVVPGPQESSNVSNYWYDILNGHLLVCFGKTTYTYKDVPYALYLDLCHAESSGKFISAWIKPRFEVVKT